MHMQSVAIDSLDGRLGVLLPLLRLTSGLPVCSAR